MVTVTVASFHLANFPLRRSLSRLFVAPAERWEVTEAEGCVLGKVMGTSKPGTTKTSIDIRRWALFAAWESAEHRAAFIENSALMARWRSNADSLTSYFLDPISSHGSWGGIDPFSALTDVRPDSGPIAVLTRAQVRWPRVWRFTRSIPPVDVALNEADGCSLAVGMGEWPIKEQATFSLWSSPQAIRSFAYDHEAHASVIRRRADENWYSEELFARFKVTATQEH
jgi:hypothetical protein